jgi:hypothetical protein
MGSTLILRDLSRCGTLASWFETNRRKLVERVASRTLSDGGEFMVKSRCFSAEEFVRARQSQV